MKKNILYFLCTIIAIIITVALLMYNNALRASLSATACTTLNELMEQQKLTFLSNIDGEIAVINTLADVISKEKVYKDKDETLEFLITAAKDSKFKHLTLVDKNGIGITSLEAEIDISQRSHFKEALQGKYSISDPIASLVDGTIIVAIATPVLDDGNVIAVLVGTYETKTLSNLFFPMFGGQGYGYICDLEGNLITKAKMQKNGVDNNVLDYLKTVKVSSKDNYNTIIQNMQISEKGHSVFFYENTKMLMHYSPLGINQWYIFASVPENVIAKEANYLLRLSLILTFLIVFLFIVLIFQIISMHRKHSAVLYKKAYFNELTGSPNSLKFNETATTLLKQNPNSKYTIIRFSIEGLDFINEIFSYTTGDTVIKSVAKSLESILDSKKECYGHIHADRFIVLVNCNTVNDTKEKLIKFEIVFTTLIQGLMSYKVKFAYGIYTIEEGETDIVSITEKVSFAYHTAKKNERIENRIQFYDSKLKEELRLEREIESRMEQALADKEFKMFLQPKYTLADEKLAGAEALVRWWVGGNFIMHPTNFIPIFEKNGFVTQLDMYMFEQACMFLRRKIDEGCKPITISVNFSRLHLLIDDFVAKLTIIADKYNLDHSLLEIEITESSMVGNEDLLLKVLGQLHDQGFTLSMDDFGSGYSSLGLLKEIPIDVVKIDKSFFENSNETERERIIISSVVDMVTKLKIHTVAEGVETKEHIDFLKGIGCEIVQGYYFAKPMPFEEFETKIMESN